jgi:hypothetical protein
MSFVSIGDLKAIRIDAMAGKPISAAQTLALLEEIQRLAALARHLQTALDGHDLAAHYKRRSTDREAG